MPLLSLGSRIAFPGGRQKERGRQLVLRAPQDSHQGRHQDQKGGPDGDSGSCELDVGAKVGTGPLTADYALVASSPFPFVLP